MKGLSACSKSASPLNYTASDAKKGFATFYSHSTCEVPFESPQLNRQKLPRFSTSSSKDRLLQTSQDSEKYLKRCFQQRHIAQRRRNREQEITKELENTIFCKFGINIGYRRRSKTELMQLTIYLINRIKNQVNPINLLYDTNEFQIKNSKLNELIKKEGLSSVEVSRKKQKLLLNEIKQVLNLNLPLKKSYNAIVSAACDYLNDYLNQTSNPIEEKPEKIESTSKLPPGISSSLNAVMLHYPHDDPQNEIRYANDSALFFAGLSPSQVQVNSTRLKKDYSEDIKRHKVSKENYQLFKELEDVIFCKFGVDIINYDSSRNKLIGATIFIIKQIKNQIEPINLVYDTDYFQERSRQVISLIDERDLSSDQVIRTKHDLLIRELKAVLDIDVSEKIVYEQIVSEACNYLNCYLNQRSNTTKHYDDDVMHVPGSIQHVEPQLLSQGSMPSTDFPREEELTLTEKFALIRLKNALNRYPIPKIDINNFGELLFAATYCIRMNSDMVPVSEFDYNQHYLKHFHTPYPHSNPRYEIEEHLDDLEKALSEESMDLAIKQCLSHQKETLRETDYLENNEFYSREDSLELKAMLTDDSLNLTVGHRKDDSDSPRVTKITAAVGLAAQLLESEEYIELQNILAYEDLIDDEPLAKKIKV